MSEDEHPTKTSPQQRDLTYGCHWFLPVSLSKDYILFGYVLTPTDIKTAAEMRGQIPDLNLETAKDLLMRGLLTSVTYSRFNTDGLAEVRHRAQVWPISGELFEKIRKAGFDIRNLGYVDQRVFSEVLGEFTLWRKDPTYPKRPFDEFRHEVCGIANGAAGLTLGYNRTGDRQVVIRCYRRAQAADVVHALREAGFAAVHAADAGVSVVDRSEA